MTLPKVGDKFVSKFGTNLCLTAINTKNTTITIRAQRRVVDRKTGEVLIEEREREVEQRNWHYVEAGYDKA